MTSKSKISFRLTSIFILGMAVVLPSFAQTYTAKIVDASDKSPIAYANIGILGSETGTNSSEEGTFSLNIPSSLNDKTLSVFLIGYEDFKIPVKEFIQRVNANNNTIQLYKKATQLNEVIIKPTKLTPARLGNYMVCNNDKGGLPFPFYIDEKKKKSGKIKREADTLTEVGTLMKVKKKKTYIDSITINVGKCTHDEILYRINIYEVKKGEPHIILKEPIYIRKKKDEIGEVLKLDLTDKNLVVNNNFIVSIERVKDLGAGEFTICGSLSGSPGYMRIASYQSSFIKIPLISFGITAYVTFSEEAKD